MAVLELPPRLSFSSLLRRGGEGRREGMEERKGRGGKRGRGWRGGGGGRGNERISKRQKETSV